MHFLSNLHTHSIYSDGADSPEAIVRAALGKGFRSIGFSDHSYLEGENWCMKYAAAGDYAAEIKKLAQKYSGQIEIYLGIEFDSSSDPVFYKDIAFDYKIAAVHEFRNERGQKWAVDDTAEIFAEATKSIGLEKAICGYYQTMSDFIGSFKADIIAHFDLVKKFNRGGRFFDEGADWYINAAFGALEKVQESGAIIEVNTGGMARGYMDEPYPSEFILKRALETGIPVTVGSDSHRKETLDFYFDGALEILRSLGFGSVKMLLGGTFADVEI
ncbi:MAG: histidinol-phosphatase [Oscillospiraceae bacterium]|nr:histidinol-phosphatase [Oscillospiraceae bacterium]